MIGHKTKCDCALCDDGTLRRSASALYEIADAMAARANSQAGLDRSPHDGMHLMVASSAMVASAFGVGRDEWLEMCTQLWVQMTGEA